MINRVCLPYFKLIFQKFEFTDELLQVYHQLLLFDGEQLTGSSTMRNPWYLSWLKSFCNCVYLWFSSRTRALNICSAIRVGYNLLVFWQEFGVIIALKHLRIDKVTVFFQSEPVLLQLLLYKVKISLHLLSSNRIGMNLSRLNSVLVSSKSVIIFWYFSTSLDPISL